MNNEENLNTLDNANAFFDECFTDIDLNEDLEEIYDLIADEEMLDDFEKQKSLTKLRNDNYKRYCDIEITKVNKLPQEFKEMIKDLLREYDLLNPSLILNATLEEVNEHEQILNNIDRRMEKLSKNIKAITKELREINDKKQSKYNIAYFNDLDLDEEIKITLIDKYNDLVLNNYVVLDDVYEELNVQLNRSNNLKEITSLLNIEKENRTNKLKKEKLEDLNEKIELEINKYREKLYYLEDLIIEDSKYKEDFDGFINFCKKIFTYDKSSYDNAKQTYDILCNDSRLSVMFNFYEEELIKEKENNIKEEKFVYEKVGIKNLKNSLDYISANYMDMLDSESKIIIEYIYNNIDSEEIDIENIEKVLNIIVQDIWKKSVTNIYEFNPNDDYCFICSNNQFIDEKYETILITKKQIERIEDYVDYQIGFICVYNNNILYMTENDDVMDVNFDDLSRLKTPKQIEHELIDFGVKNKIALNGFKTKIEAVYFINDKNMDKYKKAIELSNMYNLPLIVLNK